MRAYQSCIYIYLGISQAYKLIIPISVHKLSKYFWLNNSRDGSNYTCMYLYTVSVLKTFICTNQLKARSVLSVWGAIWHLEDVGVAATGGVQKKVTSPGKDN